MQNKKTFAFQLASTQKADTKTDSKPWQMRDGVALAGCTDRIGDGSYRYNKVGSRDGGAYC